ncbi:DUF317 domain-containing protein [Streptomyces coelicoflavus]|uniref:DUF317 domain-containing protein n=1 Tax=Streptomyces coelicoflavus TaxID=285562 RepID=UPI0036A69AAB
MHPGPAPLTATERAAVDARSVFDVTTAKSATFSPRPETVPVYLADAGDHDALLDTFLDAHAEFEKWRTWSDDTTHAIHESQTLRIERVHETLAHETAWTIAAYETPVSDRMWHLTLTDATPSPLLETLLNSLAEGDAWETAIGSPITEKTVTQATRPLTSAGWKHTIEGRWIRWETTRGDAGVQFNAFAAQNPSGLPTWTLWAGASINHPTWAIHASAYTPAPLLARLTEDLAHGTGSRTPQSPTRPPSPAKSPGLPTALSPHPSGRRP